MTPAFYIAGMDVTLVPCALTRSLNDGCFEAYIRLVPSNNQRRVRPGLPFNIPQGVISDFHCMQVGKDLSGVAWLYFGTQNRKKIFFLKIFIEFLSRYKNCSGRFSKLNKLNGSKHLLK
jgi:hypothetical protein